MAESILDLGDGLEIWRVNVDELIEQDLNARAQTKEQFERLTNTIKGDRRLEALPFCAKTDRGIEIVSGHHRVRAARAAGVTTIYVMVDVTGLTRDKIAAKQLAHNSISGYDDQQLIAKIFASIGDVDARLESFIDPKVAFQIEIPRIQVDDIDLGMKYQAVIVMFIPWEREFFDESATIIEREIHGTNAKEAWIADLAHWKDFQRVALRITHEYDIRTMSTILVKMAELAREQLGEDVTAEDESIALRDLFGKAYIPRAAADVIRSAMQRMIDNGDVTDRAKWRMVELLAADYLGGAVEAGAPQER